MAIRNRCGYNQFVKVQGKTTIYEMMDTLRSRKSSGAGKLIDLTSRFYAVNLSDCKDVTELSNVTGRAYVRSDREGYYNKKNQLRRKRA
jgi:hypothetical protein